jgi:hypothetical protein
MLRFGKYKGKTYEHVYKTDKNYCQWFVENCKGCKAFKTYILERGLFNRASLIGRSTTASELAKKISLDPEIRLFIADLWEKELNNIETTLEEEDPEDMSDILPVELEDPIETIEPSKKPARVIAKPKRNITPQLYGQFIDYFIRYQLSVHQDIAFKDRASATIINRQLDGWNNDLTWKKWTLSAFFQGVAGNKIFNATRATYSDPSLLSSFGKNILSEVATEQHANDSRAQAPSTRYLENGSYLRLSTLTLAYNFGKLGNYVNNLRVYATCNNVFTLTGYKGIDPEVNLGGLEPGMDMRYSNYPRTRSFIVGVNMNF